MEAKKVIDHIAISSPKYFCKLREMYHFGVSFFCKGYVFVTWSVKREKKINYRTHLRNTSLAPTMGQVLGSNY